MGHTFANVNISSKLKAIYMKKSFLSLAVTVFIAGAMLTNCQSSGQKTEKARNNVKDAKNEVKEAQIKLDNSIAEYTLFKKESDAKIAANEKRIADLKIKIANGKQESKAIYDKDIAWLEQTNIDLKTKLDIYNVEGKEKWEAFKTEFNHDMDELGKALNNLTINNIK
jgi:hypothetical protein